MKAEGANVEVFKPHSTRSAATSASKVTGDPIEEMFKTAGWRTSPIFEKLTITMKLLILFIVLNSPTYLVVIAVKSH